jgi:xanthine dehydrogenase accessory factor
VTGSLFGELARAIREERPVALVTSIRGPNAGSKLLVSEADALGTLGDDDLDRAAETDARGMLELGATGTRTYGAAGERRPEDVELFVESFAPPPRMYVFGAIDFAAAVTRIGRLLGYRVTLCDPRERFATKARFPDADEIVVEWPDEFLARAEVDRRTVICALTHDPKFDVPLLKAALATPAGYIGAMGSRRTHAKRSEQLLEEGVAEAELSRIAGPIGLDIGARTPEEVAVSIAAEIIALRTGASGERLVATTTSIHERSAEATT